MSSLPLVCKFLEPARVSSIVLELAESISDEPQNIQSLCDLLEETDEQTLTKVAGITRSYVFAAIDEMSDETHIDNAILLLQKLPELYDESISKIHEKLVSYISNSLHKFVPGIREQIEQSQFVIEGKSFEVEYVVYILKLLEKIFSKVKYPVDSEMDKALSFLLAMNVEDVYPEALLTLRWRMEELTKKTIGSDFVWNIIFSLIESGNKTHCTNAYIFWLRYLNNNNSQFLEDSFYQKHILQDSKYFLYLQNGLISGLHEHRKLCLSILKVSILNISTDISNSIFEYKHADKSKYMREWERFFTVFEIVAIDTSLHQTEAASSDIILLISPHSLIHSSWGFRLLSTGFRAGTEAVRKFTLNLLYSIPSSNLYLIKYALPILEDIFLPFMMLANHLVVIEDECSYGKILSDFIADMLQSCTQDSEIQAVSNSILKVLSNLKEAFDPSKIYVLLGLYQGLKGKEVLLFEESGEYLNSLFEIKSEGFLYHKVLQTLCLKLLFNFKFDVDGVLKALDKFIKFNTAELVNNHIQEIKTYIQKNDTIESDFKGSFEDDFTNAIGIYLKSLIFGKHEKIESTRVCANVIGASLDFDHFDYEFKQSVDNHLEKLVNEPQEPDVYEVLAKASSIETKLSLLSLWKSIQEDIFLEQEQVLRTLVYKYKFLNNCLNASNKELFEVESLVEFKKNIFINSRTAVIQSKDFYKVKEDMYGQFYRTVEFLTKEGVVKLCHVDIILPEISTNLANYQSNISITSFLSLFLEFELSKEQVSEISTLLLEIWANLTSTRLQLHQKDLHKSLIQTIMHPKILDLAVDNEDLAESLLEFSLAVIANSTGRRGLLPTLTKLISDYQISHNQNFHQSTWLYKVLVDAYVMQQLTSNAFKLEPVVGKVYDDVFGGEDSDLYLDVYSIHEVASDINLVVILNSIKSSEFALGLLNYIIDNQKHFNLFKVLKPTDGYEQWTRIRIFTIILCVIAEVEDESLKSHITQFIKLLETDPSPLVRVYLEWIIGMKLGAFKDLQDKLFQGLRDLIDSREMKPTLICSYQRLLVLFIKQLFFEDQQKCFERLLVILIPCATSNKAMVRHFSTSLICTLRPIMKENGMLVPADLQSIIDNIYESALSNTILGSYRNGDALLWDVKKDYTLVNISGVILMRVNDHEIDFITKEQYKRYLTPEQEDFCNIPVGDNFESLWIQDRKRTLNKTTLTINKPELLNKNPLQTKSGAWSTVMESENNKGNEIKRSDLIVVSSLVDKPPNLGGICRLCDVLGAGLLTLHDINVKTHPEFRNVAVTADHWMPMTEVTIPDIVPFLRAKKQEGYTLIGLEQTDNSVELNSDLKFPKKSLILLGKEREGVPGELLAELDMCVEIKQVGVIRSMNIQTATAIIVHAYSSQHC